MIPDLNEYQRNVRAIILALLALAGIAVVFLLVGCRQMPVLKGEYQDARVEQAKVDSKQSDRIADLCEIESGMGGVLVAALPEEHQPAVKTVVSRVTAVKAAADMQAAQHRERADREERKLETLNAAQGAGSWVAALASGNWMELISLALGALGAGGVAHGVRMKSRADRMASKAEMFAELEPDTAKKLVAVDEDLAKHRRKKS